MQTNWQKFYTLFIVQFLGAFNDNLFKNALVLLITYKGVRLFGMDSATLVAFSAGIFILPFFLFSSYSGVLADRYQKVQIAKLVKMAEVIIMILALFGFLLEWFSLLLLCLFLMGVHSTFFGPIKYSLIPHYVDENNLMKANVWVSTGTFVAILFGTILGGTLASLDSIWFLVIALFFVALLGLKASFQLEPVEVQDRDLGLGESHWSLTKKVLKLTMKERDIFSFIMGISWFWLLGSAVLTLIPMLAKVIFSAKEEVATLFLSVFVLGMGVGPFVLEKISKGKVLIWFIPVSLLSISFFIFDLAYLSNKMIKKTFIYNDPIFGLKDFLMMDGGIRTLVDLFFISCFGGMFTVPQFTMIQKMAEPQALSRLIAGNNIWNAIFMVSISVFLMMLFSMGMHLSWILGIVGGLNLLMSLALSYVHREEFNRFWKF